MAFQLGSASSLKLSDDELLSLLHSVYVDGGYTNTDRASILFQPNAVRQRGDLICARESQTGDIAGMVIVVFAHSPSRLLAKKKECEMHLLGVLPRYREQGLGKTLINAALYRGQIAKKTNMLLWTQPNMRAAHKLYLAAGFKRQARYDFSRAGHRFWFFSRSLKVKAS
jgi:ribosomal protein S18 acetylase RimI-like enzyme